MAKSLSLPGQAATADCGGRIVLRRSFRAALRTLFAFRCLFLVRCCCEPQGWRSRPSWARNDGAGRKATVPSSGRGRAADGGRAVGRLALPLAVRSRRPGDRFRPAGMRGRRKKLQDFFVDRKVARDGAIPCRWWSIGDDRIRLGRRGGRGGGFSRHGAFTRRDTLESKAVRRPRLNSTLKSLLFWMVLVVVGVLIWQFSTGSGASPSTDGVLEVPPERRRQDEVASVTITGNEITGTYNGNAGDGPASSAPTRPTQYEGLANKLTEQGRRHRARSPRRPAPGRRCSIPGRRSC